ncbi:TPA: hypothetical protein ACH3X1_012628 [Trebouxia sp. C0004]
MPSGFGCSGGAVLTIVELLEEAGLPQLCIAVAEESDASRALGGMFAEAVKAQRGGKAPKKQLWDVAGHVSQRLPDLKELIGSQARHMGQAPQQTEGQATNDSAPPGPLASSSAPASQATQAELVNNSTHVIDISPSPQHKQPHATSAQAHSSVDRELDDSAEKEHSLAAAASSLSPEELQASQHAQAMTPGIVSLLKRRKQQQPPKEAEQTQVEPEHAAPTQEVPHQQALQPEVAQHSSPKQAAEADLLDALGRAAKQVASMPAERAEPANSPNLTTAEGQMSRAEEAAQLAESDSLLDAIIAGSIDWAEVAAVTAQEHAISQQPPLPASKHSSTSQQAGLRQSQTHTRRQSQSESQIQSQIVPDHQSNGQLQDLQSGQQQQQPKLQPDAQEPVTYQSVNTKSQPTGPFQQSEAQSGASPQVSQQVPEQASKVHSDVRKPADIALRTSSRLRLRTTSPGLQSKKLRMRDAAAPQDKAERSQAAKTQGPDEVLSKLRGTGRASSQKEKQEEQIQWRVVTSESTTAEEFVKPTAEAVSQRPAWASHTTASAAASVEQKAGPSVSTAQAEAAEASVDSRALKKGELKALADRRGLNFEKLLADARSRGISVEE